MERGKGALIEPGGAGRVEYCNNQEGTSVLKAKRGKSPEGQTDHSVIALQNSSNMGQQSPAGLAPILLSDDARRGRSELNSCFNSFFVLTIYWS